MWYIFKCPFSKLLMFVIIILDYLQTWNPSFLPAPTVSAALNCSAQEEVPTKAPALSCTIISSTALYNERVHTTNYEKLVILSDVTDCNTHGTSCIMVLL